MFHLTPKRLYAIKNEKKSIINKFWQISQDRWVSRRSAREPAQHESKNAPKSCGVKTTASSLSEASLLIILVISLSLLNNFMLSCFRWNPSCGPINSVPNQIDHNSEVVCWLKHRRNFNAKQIFEDMSKEILEDMSKEILNT